MYMARSRDASSAVSPAARQVMAGIGDLLIPAAHGMPAASEVGVANDQLDVVLASRPDLAPALERALAGEGPQSPAERLAHLEAHDPEGHRAVMLAVAAAYYMHPDVQQRIGYPGQVRRSVGDIPDEELLSPALLSLIKAVQDRGPIYRPTPDPG